MLSGIKFLASRGKKMHLSSKGCAFSAVALARLVATTSLDLDAGVKKSN
jgi:hypothetical protein